MHIRKGDNVLVISGASRGKTGKVLQVLGSEELVIVAGVNLKKHHERPRRGGQKGQMIDKTMPIHVSNVSLMDSGSEKPTRAGYKMVGSKKIRVSKKTGKEI